MFRNSVFIVLFFVIIFGTYQASYPSQTPDDLYYDGFWMVKALDHLKKIAKKPHPTGSINNRKVRRYLSAELSRLGGHVTIQKTQGYNAKIRKAAPVNNVVAVFKGQHAEDKERKKLMLLSHYDSAKPYSHGAADAGSGVVVVLEALRGFLKQQPKHENDIMVVFTDGEELGLLGAHAFVEQHHLSDKIGLILNFEARGSSGPAIMWPESATGTAAMIDIYQQAQAEFPVTSSLIYEAYKLLPNDTDLTVFKEEKSINGLNFAFIDNHFNYHTVNDDLRHISYNSMMHQGLQLSALLPVVANIDLRNSYTDIDRVYFTLPGLGLINWPSYSSWLLLAVAWLLFIWVMMHAKKTGSLSLLALKTASGSWFYSSLLGAGLVYTLTQILFTWLKPQHNDILQGYPYLAYAYLLAFLLLALIVPFVIYGNRHNQPDDPTPAFVIALPAAVVWLVVFTLLTLKLPGASYLLLPVIFALVLLRLMQSFEKSAISLSVLFAAAGLLVVSLLLTLLPVALGLKSTWIMALLLSCCVAMFSPMIASHRKQFSWLLLLFPLAMFTWVSSIDHISEDKPLPTSLSYLYDVDGQQGWFYSFDQTHNDWNGERFTQPQNQDNRHAFINQHKQAVKKLQKAAEVVALEAAKISVVRDKLNSNPSKQNIVYQGHAKTDLVQIYSLNNITIQQLSINGRYLINGDPINISAGSRLIEYHLDGQKQLDIHITLADGDVIDWQVISHQFDLLHHKGLAIPVRPTNQIPKPFVLTDNTVISQRFQIETPKTDNKHSETEGTNDSAP